MQADCATRVSRMNKFNLFITQPTRNNKALFMLHPVQSNLRKKINKLLRFKKEKTRER